MYNRHSFTKYLKETNLICMNKNVPVQATFSVKSGQAKCALKRSFSCVPDKMTLQMTFLSEARWAEGTCKWLFSCMTSQVNSYTIFCVADIRANFALKIFLALMLSYFNKTAIMSR